MTDLQQAAAPLTPWVYGIAIDPSVEEGTRSVVDRASLQSGFGVEFRHEPLRRHL